MKKPVARTLHCARFRARPVQLPAQQFAGHQRQPENRRSRQDYLPRAELINQPPGQWSEERRRDILQREGKRDCGTAGIVFLTKWLEESGKGINDNRRSAQAQS